MVSFISVSSLGFLHTLPLELSCTLSVSADILSLGQCSIPLGVWKQGLCFVPVCPFVYGLVSIKVYLWLGSSHSEVGVLTLSQDLDLVWKPLTACPHAPGLENQELDGVLNKWKRLNLNPTNIPHDNPNPLQDATHYQGLYGGPF